MRFRRRVLHTLTSLAAWSLLAHLGPAAARAEPGWEPAASIGNTDGLVASASDPARPGRLWVADTASVWLSEDGGGTFSLVLHLPRAAGSARSTPEGDEAELFGELALDLEDLRDDLEDLRDDLDTASSEDGPLLDLLDRIEELDDLDLPLELPDTDDLADLDILPAPEEALDAEDLDALDLEGDGRGARPGVPSGISRLRLVGDTLFVCGSRGLHALPAATRRLGDAQPLPLGRRLAVHDVARTPEGLLLVASEAGLWVHDGVRARRARGIEPGVAVRALTLDGSLVIAATSAGLYRAASPLAPFIRAGLGGRGPEGLQDLVRVRPDLLLSAAGARGPAPPRAGARGPARWPVPGARRLFATEDGGVWAVGPRGPWRWDPAGAWRREDVGLADRRLRDGLGVTAGEGPSEVWVVGAAGAWRRIADAGAPVSRHADHQIQRALARRPSLTQLLWAAEARRALTLEAVDSHAADERLSWLLPTVQLRFTATLQRDERASFVPALGALALDRVDVLPRSASLQLFVFWDLLPALLAALEPARARTYAAIRGETRETQRRLRETLPGLWRRWESQQRALWERPPLSVRGALRASVGVAQLEAQLSALTAGAFPVSPTFEAILFPEEETR